MRYIILYEDNIKVKASRKRFFAERKYYNDCPPSFGLMYYCYERLNHKTRKNVRLLEIWRKAI